MDLERRMAEEYGGRLKNRWLSNRGTVIVNQS